MAIDCGGICSFHYLMQQQWKNKPVRLLSVFVISYFLAVVFYLNYSLTKVVQELPDIVISGPDTFCRSTPFHSSVDVDEPNEIFFLETSGENCLTPRQACSVESAARMNPQMRITLHTDTGGSFSPSASSTPRHRRADTLGNQRNCDVMEILKHLPNVNVTRSRLADELRSTVLWDRWYDIGRLKQSQFPHVHLSDAVRIAILHKRGGIYLDLDCIVLRPLHCLRNTAGYLTSLPSWIENGVLSFDRSHPFLKFLMRVMAQYYKPDMRESMGPPSLAFALKFYCDVGLNASFQHATPYQCHSGPSIQLQNPDSFYAIQSVDSRKFVDPEIDESVLRTLTDSYVSHVYFHTKHKVPLSSLYASFARQYCPSIYQILKHDF